MLKGANNWVICAASAKGAGHEICQDSYEYQRMSNQVVVAVVSDGAGSYRHSHIGAKVITKCAKNLFCDFVLNNDIINITESGWRNCCIDIVIKIRRLIKNYSVRNQLPIQALSSTLIVAVFTPNRLLTMHIGDGRAGYRNKKGEWFSAMVPFKGSQVGETVFVTTPWIVENKDLYIKAEIFSEQLSCVVLLSDGIEFSAFECLVENEDGEFEERNKPYPGFFNPIVDYVYKNRGKKNLNKEWYRFLCNGTPRLESEPDDKTMIIAICPPI